MTSGAFWRRECLQIFFINFSFINFGKRPRHLKNAINIEQQLLAGSHCPVHRTKKKPIKRRVPLNTFKLYLLAGRPFNKILYSMIWKEKKKREPKEKRKKMCCRWENIENWSKEMEKANTEKNRLCNIKIGYLWMVLSSSNQTALDVSAFLHTI